MQQLRHPNVVEFKDVFENEVGEKSGEGPVIYIITEPVTPLCERLKSLALQGEDKYENRRDGLWVFILLVLRC
jgi:hypothetical protein